MRPEVLLLMTIDTEEDNWLPTRDDLTVENIQQLPQLQKFLSRLGGRPTYFVTYQVMVDPRAREIIKTVAGEDGVEIGGHLHPWNTPPMDEVMVGQNTMMKNLPADLQLAKLRTLTDLLENNLGTRPRSFRAGRYGLGRESVAALLECGYTVDSSVTPYIDWTEYDNGSDYEGAPNHWYRISRGGDLRIPNPDGDLIEIPSSSGYTRRPFDSWHSVSTLMDRKLIRTLRVRGLAARTGCFKKLHLTPETETVANMIRLAKRLIEDGTEHVEISWHSPTLMAGLNDFASDANGVEKLYSKIEEFVSEMKRLFSVRFATVGEAADILSAGESTSGAESTRGAIVTRPPIKILTNAPGQERSETWESHTEKVDSTGNPHGLGALIQGWRMWRKGNAFDCVVLGEGRSDLFYSVLSGLLPFKRPPIIRIDCLWYKPLTPLHGLIKNIIFRLERRTVAAYIVWASREIRDYAAAYGLDEARLHFVPYHHTLDDESIVPADEGYIFSGGNFARDYATLFEAVKDIDCPVRIGATRPEIFKGLTVPSNVEIQGYSHSGFVRAIANCTMNVVPLESGLLHSGGQQTFLNSMAFGKPTIVSDPEGASDYIKDGENGWLIPPNDPARLREVIERILNDREYANAIGARAKEVLKTHTTEKHFQSIMDVIKFQLGHPRGQR